MNPKIYDSLLEMANFCITHHWGKELVQVSQCFCTLFVVEGEMAPDLSTSKKGAWEIQMKKLEQEWQLCRRAVSERYRATGLVASLNA